MTDEIEPTLKNDYNEILDQNLTPKAMKQAVAILIPKSGDTTSTSNYRPTDYKIQAKYINKIY